MDLLKLNHECHAEEVKQGLHGKKRATSKSAKEESALFDMEEYEE